MKINISYMEAVAQFPTEVIDLIKEIQASGNQKTDTLPSTWKWDIEWCERVQGSTIDQIMGELKSGTKAPNRHAKLDTLVDSVDGLHLAATCFRTYRYRELNTIPEVLMDHLKNRVEIFNAEAASFSAMTQDEKDEELHKLLKEIPGLFMVSM